MSVLIDSPTCYDGTEKGRPVSLVLDLPAELETELAAEANHLGVPLAEYVLRLLAGAPAASPAPRTGTELLAYWQGEGLVGTRPEITDAPAHARTLREQAQRRARPVTDGPQAGSAAPDRLANGTGLYAGFVRFHGLSPFARPRRPRRVDRCMRDWPVRNLVYL